MKKKQYHKDYNDFWREANKVIKFALDNQYDLQNDY